MKALILLLSFIGLAIVIWQNSQPVSLILFGLILPVKLPLAVWLGLFLFVGILTSLALQFLYRFPRQNKRRSLDTEEQIESRLTSPPTTFSAAKSNTTNDFTNQSPQIENEEQPNNLYDSNTDYVKQNREVRSTQSLSDERSDIYDANFRVVEHNSSTQPKPEKQDNDEENWI